ncbi:hypothetical protein Hanom_Chr14g01254391 [Helianthus anomalus]
MKLNLNYIITLVLCCFEQFVRLIPMFLPSVGEKAHYFAKAARKKAEYEIGIKQHIDNLNETAMEISTTSSMNTNEDVELEVNSQIVKVL